MTEESPDPPGSSACVAAIPGLEASFK